MWCRRKSDDKPLGSEIIACIKALHGSGYRRRVDKLQHVTPRNIAEHAGNHLSLLRVNGNMYA